MLDVRGVSMVYDPPKGLLRILVRAAATESVQALTDVDLHVSAGEVLGLIGPNGAGKSTLIRSITGLVQPTAGSITIDGLTIRPDDPEITRRFGLSLPEERSFHWRLTGRQNLEYFATLAGLDKATTRERVDTAMVERGLDHRDKAVFGYSSGMLAQLGIARAMLHDPPLLLLDEPTRSLDPIAGREVCNQVRALAANGTAVLMANHRLDEVVHACDRVVALVGGRIRWSGDAAEIADDPTGLGRRLERLVDEDAAARAEGAGHDR
ncbi:MAG: ABC transporter ATP-binding protein [Actinomycetota bacterium]